MSPALAADVTAGPITIVKPWARATPGGAKITAGYLTIRNTSDQPDRLIGVASGEADHAAPHSMSMKNGIMEMRPIPDGVLIPAHGEAVLKPGANHLMFEGLKHPLKKGDSFPTTLTFKDAGAVAVDFAVEGVGAQSSSATMPPGMKME